jgi:hypothetical protein
MSLPRYLTAPTAMDQRRPMIMFFPREWRSRSPDSPNNKIIETIAGNALAYLSPAVHLNPARSSLPTLKLQLARTRCFWSTCRVTPFLDDGDIDLTVTSLYGRLLRSLNSTNLHDHCSNDVVRGPSNCHHGDNITFILLQANQTSPVWKLSTRC